MRAYCIKETIAPFANKWQIQAGRETKGSRATPLLLMGFDGTVGRLVFRCSGWRCGGREDLD